MRLCRYDGWVLVRTLYVNDIYLISIGYCSATFPLQHIDLHIYIFSPHTCCVEVERQVKEEVSK